MSVKVRFVIIAALFGLASLAIVDVVYTTTNFWLLIPGFIGVAIFGPWSYYLYAKMKETPRPTHQEIIANAQIESKAKKG